MGDTQPPPTGKFYSSVYLDPGPATRDSRRWRTQLLGYLMRQNDIDLDDLKAMVQTHLGLDVPTWRSFFEQGEIPDLLDTITLVWLQFQRYRMQSQAEHWREFVRISVRARNLGYRIDDECGVHPLVDAEFERNRVSAIASLASPRYAAALERFESAHAALEEHPPDGKKAIEDTFESAEILVKLLCNSSKLQRLASDAIEHHLKPIVRKLYAGNEPALQASNLFLNSFGKWVDAAHNYRHGPKAEKPISAPLDLAIAMMSSGASFVRWLADIDQQVCAVKSN